jgi:hypothetical protein
MPWILTNSGPQWFDTAPPGTLPSQIYPTTNTGGAVAFNDPNVKPTNAPQYGVFGPGVSTNVGPGGGSPSGTPLVNPTTGQVVPPGYTIDPKTGNTVANAAPPPGTTVDPKTGALLDPTGNIISDLTSQMPGIFGTGTYQAHAFPINQGAITGNPTQGA